MSQLRAILAILAICPAHTISLTPPMTQWSCWPEATAALHVHPTSKITVHPHAIRSRVRLPRASQPCSRPWAGTPSSRARCPTTSGLSARGHAGCGSDGIPRRCHWEERVTRGAHPLINSPHPHNPGVIPPHSLSLPFRIPLIYSMRARWMPLTNFRLISPVDPPCRPGS